MAEVVVITGASAGIGRATAVAFARRGAAVGLLARGRTGLDGARRDVEQAGGRALVIPTDVADAAQVEAAADRVERELGPIDVWINAAMTAILAEVRNTQPEEFRRVVEVTFLGSVHGVMAALRRMQERDRGTIVQVGSALARRGIPLQATYCGAKHGVQGFVESLRTELLHQGSNVKISMVQLPGLNTPQFGWVRTRGLSKHPRPVAPVYAPEVAAEAILWAAGHRRRELWVGLPTYYTILGNRLAPGFQDWFLAKKAYAGQQSDRDLSPDRRDYLFDAVDADEDRGAHGIFADEAKPSSRALWATTHRRSIAAAAGGVIAAGALMARRS
jgi:short-subunit dehydrogenase